MDVALNFINNSNDLHNSQIVIFQKNVADSEQHSIAWTVIRNCDIGEYHPFVFPHNSHVSAGDDFGNYTVQMDAAPGDRFEAKQTGSGSGLVHGGRATSPTEIQVTNKLASGPISANIYKDGKLLGVKHGLAQHEMAAFDFKPTIWIGAVGEIDQGKAIDPLVVDQIGTELSLTGIASADIVMSGGGSGPDAAPFTFRLQNIVEA